MKCPTCLLQTHKKALHSFLTVAIPQTLPSQFCVQSVPFAVSLYSFYVTSLYSSSCSASPQSRFHFLLTGNSDGDCHPNEKNFIKDGFSSYKSSYRIFALVFCLCLLLCFVLLAVLSNLHGRKEFSQSEALESQPIEDQTSARRPSIARTDVNFALDTIGTGKFASFLNSFHDILD